MKSRQSPLAKHAEATDCSAGRRGNRQDRIGNSAIADQLPKQKATDVKPNRWEQGIRSSLGDPMQKDLEDIGAAFGADFSGVTVRRNSEKPKALGAEAMVAGGEVHLKPGAYQPGTQGGKKLLAHELAHLQQQQGKSPEKSPEVREVQGTLESTRALLGAALAGLEEGRTEAAENGQAVGAEVARRHLEKALRELEKLDGGEDAAEAAGLSCLFLAEVNHPDAGKAKALGDRFSDRDGGQGDGLEQEAERSAAAAVRGEAVDIAAQNTPEIQRFAPAAAVALAPPTWALVAVGVLGSLAVAAAGTMAWDWGKENGPFLAQAVRERLKTIAGTDAMPIPKTKERERGQMRFQVQWNSNQVAGKGDFSERAVAPDEMGVTVAQAVAALAIVHAKVQPRAAREASKGAIAKAIGWVQRAPTGGGIYGGTSGSKSFDFNYDRGSRVDIENQAGHNLRR